MVSALGKPTVVIVVYMHIGVKSSMCVLCAVTLYVDFSLECLLLLKANSYYLSLGTSITLVLCSAQNLAYFSSLTLDINECAQNNGGCVRFCQNTEGSFFCHCGDGYSLNKDGSQCHGKNLGWQLLIDSIFVQQLPFNNDC